MFIFKSYNYDQSARSAHFRYQNNGVDFEEIIEFKDVSEEYNEDALQGALFLAFITIGVSYIKTFPSKDVELSVGALDEWQSTFFNAVYQEGMSQFAFENNLTREDLAHFQGTSMAAESLVSNSDSPETAPIVLQSGGKDSLLLAELMNKKDMSFAPWYVSSVDTHPQVLDQLGHELHTVKRLIDHEGLKQAAKKGGLDGHVPVTYIVLSLAVLQAVLSNKQIVLAAIGHEGEEPYGMIGDLPVRHQWAKTWEAEQQFALYVARYVSPQINIGSPLRRYSELKIAELFVENCWQKYSMQFSSCNIGNYKQGQDNQVLGWCGECAKCANSFLLFAPFVEPADLTRVFNGENLFNKDSLTDTFKGILEIDGAQKPFECIGETDELRLAYHMARKRAAEYTLNFDVPDSEFDYKKEYPAQPWSDKYC